jgi:dimethylargininase
MFSKAIVRPPGRNFASGLTRVDLGAPVFEVALAQHEAYCAALERCGVTLIRLPADERFPDSTFVEDTAVITTRGAIITRPGAPTRAGETEEIAEVLAQIYPSVQRLEAPGTVDGGDVCEAGDHFFIGISERTNEAGAKQLAELLNDFGYQSTLVDIRNVDGILHLKSGVAGLADNRLVAIEGLAHRAEFAGCDLLGVTSGEEYAANCVQVNEFVLVAAGFPVIEQTLREFGHQTLALSMSEFQKMDGGLSCLSLRF